MSISLGIDLWDKPDAIVGFNENNNIVVERLQRLFGEFCKSQLTHTYNQKRLIEKFMNDNELLKKSEFNFTSGAYFLSEQVFDIINAHETFSNAFLNEVDEIIKSKNANIKKECRIIKNEKKKLFEELTRENQKLSCDLKRYRNRFNVKEYAYLASVKAEENKALSRNQVDDFQSVYLSRKAQYEDAKNDYKRSVENFNKYQLKYYSSLMNEWGAKAKCVEHERYNVMKATFTNLSELCRSLASKFNEIADRIESRTDMIECEKDCSTLVNQEKTGELPPGDVLFEDLDNKERAEIFIDAARTSKISTNSGSDSTSSNDDSKKLPKDQIQKRTQSLCRSSTGGSSTENGAIINGYWGSGSKIFGKLFGGSKKLKESATPIVPSKLEKLESLKEEKSTVNIETEHADEIDLVPEMAALPVDSSTNDNCPTRKPSVIKKLFTLRSMRQHSVNKSFEEPIIRAHKSRSIFRKTGRSASSRLETPRSKSVSSIITDKQELSAPNPDQTQHEKKPRVSLERIFSKPKLGQKPNSRSQTMSYNNSGRGGVDRIHSLTIEALLPMSPVQIVSTPAEALAIVARSSWQYISPPSSPDPRLSGLFSSPPSSPDPLAPVTRSSGLFSSPSSSPGPDIFIDDKVNENHDDKIISEPVENDSVEYYYVGSCVAIHDYESTDSSKVFLTFSKGQQFYIIKDENGSEHCGWLLVETIDRTQSGYVPASYMDTRQFESAVRMLSNHPVVTS